MRKAFFTVVMMMMAVTMTAQTLNEYEKKIVELISNGEPFELREQLDAHSAELSPLVRTYGEAGASSALNQNARAVEALKTLFNEYLSSFNGDTVLEMFRTAASCLEADYRYDEAATLLDQAVAMLQSAEGAPQEAIDFFKKKAATYHVMASFPAMTYDARDDGYDAPMLPDTITHNGHTSVFLNTEGSVNGHKTPMLFDTGAAYSIITPEAAKEYGLKLSTAGADVDGASAISGTYALADDVEIGTLHLHNVILFVTPITAGHDSIDEVLSKVKMIVGLNVMQKMQEVTLDFKNRNIHFPAKPHDFPKANMRRNTQTKLFSVRAMHNGEPVDMGVDSGCTGFGNLGYEYYMKHRDDYNESSETVREMVAGVGGATEMTNFVERDFTIAIGEKVIRVPEIEVPAVQAEGAVSSRSLFGVQSMSLMERLTISFKDAYIY